MSLQIGVNVSERQTDLAPVIDLFPGRQQPNLLNLLTALQTTLELEPLLRIFSGEVRRRVEHQSVQFRDEQRGIDLKLGRTGRHRASYQLNLFGMPLGEVAFTRPSRFVEVELKELEQLLCHLVYPLRNALLYRDAVVVAQRDPLTQVGNRGAFDEAYAREVHMASRHGLPLTLILVDIDLFKGVNDRYGHAVGDRVLKQVAETLRHAIRQSDLLFRYGGEEFAVVLANTDLAGAALVAERIRAMVAAAPAAQEPPVTVSVGVAELERGEGGLSLFERTDRALYRAKEQGRNRVVLGADLQ